MIAKVIPCLIILMMTNPVQIRTEVEICNATSFNDVIVSVKAKSTILNINEDLIKYFSEIGTGFNELLSFLEFSRNKTEKESGNQSNKKDEEQFFDHLLYLAILINCIWLVIGIIFTYNFLTQRIVLSRKVSAY
jgi:hypothetical protein